MQLNMSVKFVVGLPRMTEIMAVVTEVVVLVEDGVNRGHGLGHTETTSQ